MAIPGTPAIALPAFTAPAFNSPSIANGGVIAPIIVENEASTVSVNHPFTIGHLFGQGELKMSDSLVGKRAGQADIALQFDPKATWPDGSVRHGVISGIIPSIAGNALVTVNLTRSTAARDNTPVTPASIAATGANPIATVVVGGVTYTADIDAALVAGVGIKTWLAGPVCTEYILDLVFKTGQGVVEPALTLQCAIRYYPASGRIKIDLTHENGNYAYPPGGDAITTVVAVTYNTSISIGGNVTRAQSNLLHRPGARWYNSFWFGGDPGLHIKYDLPYLVSTRMVPNYDTSQVIPESVIAANYPPEYADIPPMSSGLYSGYMPTSGGRPDLGIHPRWVSDYLLSQDKRVKKVAIGGSISGGAWNVHARSRNPGPSYGHAIDVVHYPYLGYERWQDCINPDTAKNEIYPLDQSTQQGFTADVSHMPNFSAMAYMLTGDYFHLEEMIFWASYANWSMNPQYRGLSNGYVRAHPPRAQAWALRTIAFCAALIPDDHPMKPVHTHILNKNLEWYNAEYTDNPSANVLGLIVNGEMWAYGPGRLAPWQNDYFTLVVGVVADMGFTEANRLFQWTARFPVGRLIGEGYCWRESVAYQMLVKDGDNSPIYSTFAELYQKNFSDMPACPTVGDVGEATVPFGYAAIMEAALAYAIDRSVPGAQAAYDRLMDRLSHPNYAEAGTQYAIVPRSASLPIDIDPDPDPDPEDPPVIPDNPPQGTRMKTANRVSETTTATTTATITLLGKASGRRSFAQGFTVGTTGIKVNIEDDAGNFLEGVYTLTNATTLTRTSILGSSNNGADVTFPAGTKRVFHDVLAQDFDTLLSTADTVEVTSLQTVTPTTAHLVALTDATTGVGCKATLGAVLALGGGTQAPADTTAPSAPSNLASSAVTQTAFTINFTAGTDNVGVARSEWSLDGTTWTAIGSATTFNVTGRTAATLHNVRVRTVDTSGNVSTAATLNVTTAAVSGDTTAPSMSGSITVSAVTSSGYTFGYSAGSDNVAIDHYETSIDGGTTWASNGTNLSRVVTGRPASTTDQLRVRAHDAAGNISNVLSATATTTAAASEYTGPDYVLSIKQGVDNAGPEFFGFCQLPASPAARPVVSNVALRIWTADHLASLPDGVTVKGGWYRVGAPEIPFADSQFGWPMSKTGWNDGTPNNHAYFGLYTMDGGTKYIQGAGLDGNFEFRVGASNGFKKTYTENGAPYVLVVT